MGSEMCIRDRSISPARPAHSSKPIHRQVCCSCCCVLMLGQTDARTHDRCLDPFPHTYYSIPIRAKKFRFDSIRLSPPSRFFFRFDSIRQSDKFAACRLYTDIKIVMMVSLLKGLAASLYAVVHSVPYQYQLDNFQ